MHELARSANYSILADHDYVYLRQIGERSQIGWMYGNAQGAFIDYRERWAVIIGCGVWVIRFPLPEGKTADNAPEISKADTFAGKAQAFANAPFVCLMNDANDGLWPEVVYDPDNGENIVRLVEDLNATDAGIYDLNVMTLEIRRRALCVTDKVE